MVIFIEKIKIMLKENKELRMKIGELEEILGDYKLKKVKRIGEKMEF